MAIDRPDQVWCADITYIPVQRGFLYLVAVMDWATRHVLAWRLSNTMDAGFCVEALAEALARHLRREGIEAGRHRVRRLMRLMGLEAIYQAPRTS